MPYHMQQRRKNNNQQMCLRCDVEALLLFGQVELNSDFWRQLQT